MSFDPRFEMPVLVRQVGEVYVDANLLVACLRAIEALGGIEYPFGFAQHDAPVSVYPARQSANNEETGR